MKNINLKDYDYIVIAFSGGKDSTACVLDILEAGVPKHKIELWHHEIDGREGSNLMDWPCTPDYCKAFAKALGLKIYFSWKMHGFEGEMLREDSLTKPSKFETPDGKVIQVGGIRGKKSTRRKFPQVSADLKVRWCSGYLKIDVGEKAIANQKRFNGKKTLFVSGERAEESEQRSNYKVFEPDRTDRRDGKLKRHVDRYRPVHGWKEAEVWDIIKRWKINPHPAYRLGWGRLSCMACIFGSKDQWASIKKIDSARFGVIADYEKEFGFTINRDHSITELAKKGKAYDMKESDIRSAMNKKYREEIFIKNWKLPSGAFGENCGSP